MRIKKMRIENVSSVSRNKDKIVLSCKNNTLKEIPASMVLEYAFSHASWIEISGNKPPDPFEEGFAVEFDKPLTCELIGVASPYGFSCTSTKEELEKQDRDEATERRYGF